MCWLQCLCVDQLGTCSSHDSSFSFLPPSLQGNVAQNKRSWECTVLLQPHKSLLVEYSAAFLMEEI